jgi:hypothetical protein
MELTSKIIAYESGEGDANDVLELFSGLIRSGLVWSLQGHYGRTATMLIEKGYLNYEGKILKRVQ